MSRVLSVGQCGFDHGAISRHLAGRFGAEVVPADTHEEAIARLKAGDIALVLVNRVGDLDGAPGLDFIRRLKADPGLADVPVMLVSNYDDAQARAVALGALPGFGKAALHSADVEAKLDAALSPAGRAGRHDADDPT